MKKLDLHGIRHQNASNMADTFSNFKQGVFCWWKQKNDSKNHFSVILDSTLNFDNTAGSTFSSIPKGTTISAGENLTVFGLFFSNRESFYRQRMELNDRLSYIIKYESLYGEQYEVSHNMEK